MRMISLETAIDEISAYAKRLKEEKYHAGAKVIRECHRILTSLPSIERGNCQSCARCSDKGNCQSCARCSDNGGFYDDGRTRCPIEEHYALPKDGSCHLWEALKA